MRTLSSTLLAAQKASSRVPFIKVEARNKLAGAVNLRWERLYSGSELDSLHAMAIPGDGSLVRARATPVSDNGKLYRQRVASPGPASDYSQWSYLDQYGVKALALCALGAEVSLFWVESDASINYSKSTDYGVNWSSALYLGYAPTAEVGGMAAAYRPDGDLALFFTQSSRLFVIKRISGAWQSRIEWDETTAGLTGVALYYDGDWNLLVSGQASDGDYKVWSLVYGDGDEVAAGSWSGLKEIASAPYEGSFEYAGVSLDKPDAVYRCFFVEKFTGNEAYHRYFHSHTLPDTVFLDNRWREPVPFNHESLYGPSLAHNADYSWLATPCGVWRAALAEECLDLSADVLSVKEELSADSESLLVNLRNDDGRYASPGEGVLQCLVTGCEIDFSPGYSTADGDESVTGRSYNLQAYEHTSSPGKAALFLYTDGGWAALERWTARYQLRWNQPDEYGYAVQETAVKEILVQLLARAGLRLEVVSESDDIGSYYPDFTVHAGDSGLTVVARLLSFVPDLLFLEGNSAYLVNPQITDSSVYSYVVSGSYGAADHVILEGRYRRDAWKINRVLVEGLNPVGPAVIAAESFDWDEIERGCDRLEMLEDLNVSSVELARDRGAAWLRRAEIESITGFIRVPVNCGQQVYDVVDITDARAGLDAAKRRVLGMSLSYLPARAQYEQVLKLGAV
ncbi:MAG: hypothetical protein JXA46_04660 [Dehalococcoidales bacterium]|nr:hypothetical protein [Dehalococcoidales bacterium]